MGFLWLHGNVLLTQEACVALDPRASPTDQQGARIALECFNKYIVEEGKRGDGPLCSFELFLNGLSMFRMAVGGNLGISGGCSSITAFSRAKVLSAEGNQPPALREPGAGTRFSTVKSREGTLLVGLPARQPGNPATLLSGSIGKSILASSCPSFPDPFFPHRCRNFKFEWCSEVPTVRQKGASEDEQCMTTT